MQMQGNNYKIQSEIVFVNIKQELKITQQVVFQSCKLPLAVLIQYRSVTDTQTDTRRRHIPRLA